MMHLIIDAFVRDNQMLGSEKAIFDLLDNYPSRIGMTKISTPCVLTYTGPVPEDWGVSGLVVIAESHISIHTFPDRSFVNVDVFSCRDFDAEWVVEDLKKELGFVRFKSCLLPRGWDRFEEQARWAEATLSLDR